MLANHNDLHADHRKNAAQWISNLTIVGCLTLALCGCAAIAPQPTAPVAVAVPTAWSTVVIAAPNGSSSLVQWWSRFNDPLLSNLMSQALQANTSIKSAEAVLQQTRALRDVSAAALLPVVGSSTSARRSQVGSNSAVNSFEAGLDASWELDLFGANRSALDASDATVLASAATLGDVQVSIAAEIALDYIALRGAQVLLAIANDNLSSQLETLQIAQWRLQAGLVTSLEVEQARTEAEQTRAQLPVLQTSIEQSRYALAVLIGQPPAALSTVLTASGPVPQTDDNLALSLPAETLRQRPDVRAAEDQVTAAIARVAQADAALAPNFQIGGSLGLSALTLGALTHGASVVSVLLASVSLPVFDGGALRAQVRAQQAVLDQAYMAYQAAVLTALKDVEDALVALRNDRERLLYLQRAAEAAVNAALLARQRYGSGLVDFQTVLDTQRTQLNTQYSVATARATLSADHVRLYKALGGGWNPNGGDATAALTESRTYRP
ncbi:MAG: efflux transporter outer membrane subunit [Candidatus Competibacteraceae bacterium]|nr:efflux transporter outer membrane subunit [Candidatus Competibacteraceae bacterium]